MFNSEAPTLLLVILALVLRIQIAPEDPSLSPTTHNMTNNLSWYPASSLVKSTYYDTGNKHQSMVYVHLVIQARRNVFPNTNCGVKGFLLYISLILICQASDTETNPVQPPSYPMVSVPKLLNGTQIDQP